MTRAEVFVGIDVSKARLDVALGFAGELMGVDNDARGIAELVGRLLKLGPELIVLEASGGLATGLVGELAAAQMPVAVVNPRQVREFTRCTGSRPRPTRLTRVLWRCSRSGSSRRSGSCPMSRPAGCRRWLPASVNWSKC